MEEIYKSHDEAPEEVTVDLPLSTKAGIFLGTAGVASLADIVAHWGITGLALGGFTAFALAKSSPQMYEVLRKHCPSLPARSSGRSGERTLWERLTNQYPEAPEESTPIPEDHQPQPYPDLPMGELSGLHEHAIPLPTATHFTFSQVLTRFTPSLDRLFLALLPDGTPVFCAARDLCHVALAGATDGGKSSILRLLLAQLCKAGASVLLLNPHYTHFDREAHPPEDWTPLEPYLLHDPMACRKYEVIEFYLKQIATELLPKRLEKYAHSQPLGRPYFIAVEELPAIVAKIKEAPDYLAQILREGRKVGIFLITVAQDFLVSTIAPGGGGAVRDCYRTAYYVGGDGATARILLDLPVRLLSEGELGQGTVMLRSNRVKLVKQAQLVRVPYVENQALYRLLGPSTYVSTITPGWERAEEILLESTQPGQALRAQQQDSSWAPLPNAEQPQAAPASLSPGPAGPRPVPTRLQQVVRVYKPGMSLTWLAEQLGVSEEKAYTWLREAKVRRLIATGPTKLKQQGEQTQDTKAPEKQPSLLERGVTAYRAGARSQSKLASALGISAWEARLLMPKVQAEIERQDEQGK